MFLDFLTSIVHKNKKTSVLIVDLRYSVEIYSNVSTEITKKKKRKSSNLFDPSKKVEP